MPPVEYKYKKDGSIDLEETIILPKKEQQEKRQAKLPPRGQGCKVVIKSDGSLDGEETVIDNKIPDDSKKEMVLHLVMAGIVLMTLWYCWPAIVVLI